MSADAVVSRVARGADLDAIRSILSKRPITTNSITNPAFDPATIQRDAQETRIVVHRRYPQLVKEFLRHKRYHGSSVEKRLYSAHDWTWEKQVARLIEKRPLAFLTRDDNTMLRDGTNVHRLTPEWDRVGTDNEDANKHLKFSEYLSYDEIMLGSLLGVSSPSYFINDGARMNRGIPGHPESFEPRGIIIGLVGARFERPGRMDSIFIEPKDHHTRQHPDLTSIFRRFFAGDAASHNNNHAFDTKMYRARMRLTAEILLLEADSRARAAGRKAYVFVPGLGLGVWAVHDEQARLYVEAFAAALRDLASANRLSAIETLEFSWVDAPSDARAMIREECRRARVDVLFSKREPAARLRGDKVGQLLVLAYAWDGNAFPGNEYWKGMLTASGDPAAACMSTISELHNPVINPDFLRRIRVAGSD